ncbi:hypothetical protein [Nocardioides jensenii]|uniref:hypothetical protein n=1 Tax=Nocardioides jensenii TaxID=1843 RepID=UPI0012F9FE6C|nr:hypothetical protein [Nocardioides jensenii]
MTDFEMVVVDGIRYRPEDAPKRPEGGSGEPDEAKTVTTKVARPRNKARSTTPNKE